MTIQTNKKIVHPISRRLKELGKTQRWLAGEMKMSEQSISNYVNRKIILCRDDSKTQRLIRILGISIDYLRTF